MAAKDHYHFRERRAPGQAFLSEVCDTRSTGDFNIGISIKFSCCSNHRDQRGVDSYNKSCLLTIAWYHVEYGQIALAVCSKSYSATGLIHHSSGFSGHWQSRNWEAEQVLKILLPGRPGWLHSRLALTNVMHITFPHDFNKMSTLILMKMTSNNKTFQISLPTRNMNGTEKVRSHDWLVSLSLLLSSRQICQQSVLLVGKTGCITNTSRHFLWNSLSQTSEHAWLAANIPQEAGDFSSF